MWILQSYALSDDLTFPHRSTCNYNEVQVNQTDRIQMTNELRSIAVIIQKRESIITSDDENNTNYSMLEKKQCCCFVLLRIL
jgi:hypothetical protein